MGSLVMGAKMPIEVDKGISLLSFIVNKAMVTLIRTMAEMGMME